MAEASSHAKPQQVPILLSSVDRLRDLDYPYNLTLNWYNVSIKPHMVTNIIENMDIAKESPNLNLRESSNPLQTISRKIKTLEALGWETTLWGVRL